MSLKSRSFEVNRRAIDAALPKVDQEISARGVIIMMAHWPNQLNLDLAMDLMITIRPVTALRTLLSSSEPQCNISNQEGRAGAAA